MLGAGACGWAGMGRACSGAGGEDAEVAAGLPYFQAQEAGHLSRGGGGQGNMMVGGSEMPVPCPCPCCCPSVPSHSLRQPCCCRTPNPLTPALPVPLSPKLQSPAPRAMLVPLTPDPQPPSAASAPVPPHLCSEFKSDEEFLSKQDTIWTSSNWELLVVAYLALRYFLHTAAGDRRVCDPGSQTRDALEMEKGKSNRDANSPSLDSACLA